MLFRRLYENTISEPAVPLSDNYRPIQELNGRVVYSSVFHSVNSTDVADGDRTTISVIMTTDAKSSAPTISVLYATSVFIVTNILLLIFFC